jgi:2-methylcitrate dehydratase
MDNFLAEGETCHPSDNFGSMLSAAEYAGGSGRELLTAMAVAYQVQCRLTEASPIMRNGFDHTTQLSFSVAAGASRLLGLSTDRTANALSIAGVNCVALGVIRAEPVSQWKGLASAHTAADAIRATMLARDGITGPVAVFEGHSGFMEALDTRCYVDWSNQGLELVNRALIKRYNAEAHSQSALEGILQLREQHRIRGGQVKSVTIDIFQTAYNIIGGGEFGAKDQVQTKEQADHNLPYLAAVALLDGTVEPAQFTPQRIRRRDVQSLMHKVSVRPSRLYTWRYPNEMCCKVVIRLKGGPKYTIKKTGYRGFFATPMPWTEVVQKFERLAEPFTTGALRRQLIDAVQNLEDVQTTDLTRLLARARSRSKRRRGSTRASAPRSMPQPARR